MHRDYQTIQVTLVDRVWRVGARLGIVESYEWPSWKSMRAILEACGLKVTQRDQPGLQRRAHSLPAIRGIELSEDVAKMRVNGRDGQF